MVLAGFICFLIFGFFSLCISPDKPGYAAILLGGGFLFFLAGFYFETYAPQYMWPEVELSQDETPAEMTQANELHPYPQESP